MDRVALGVLRNQGGAVLDSVGRMEALTVTRHGHLGAELRPLPRAPAGAAAWPERWRHLSAVDLERPRADIDAGVDSSL
jgi:antitoxin (DNA-binding transcriptional repressor) of toxin-antitoxin stability system